MSRLKDLKERENESCRCKNAERLNNHCDNVLLIYEAIKDHIEDDAVKRNCFVLVLDHDRTKRSEPERYAYQQWHYPTEYEGTDYELFKQAWNHHQKYNPHHWQYWVLIGDNGILTPLDMQEEYVIEMLCDWSAMSLVYGDSPGGFYNSKRNIMMLSDNTRVLIEKMLPYFDQAVEEVARGN